MTPPSPTSKRRGGQPGNNNALRHGFYSRYFTSRDNLDLDDHVKGEFIDELNTARVCTRNLVAMLEDASSLPPQDVISIYRAIGTFLGHTISLTRSRHFIFQRTTSLEDAIAELSQIPVDKEAPW